MNRRKLTRCLAATLVASIILFMASPAEAAAAKPLKTFGTGDVIATEDSATIVNDSGEYGGVYLQSKSTSSKSLGGVVFEFRNLSTGDVEGGSPRLSLPIDTDGKANTNNGHAFIDVAGCGGTEGVDTLVSTQSAVCSVFFDGVTYTNWNAFAAANPTYKTGQGYIPFVIADVPGSYAVDHIVLRT